MTGEEHTAQTSRGPDEKYQKFGHPAVGIAAAILIAAVSIVIASRVTDGFSTAPAVAVLATLLSAGILMLVFTLTRAAIWAYQGEFRD